MNQSKKVGILVAGGPAPGINSVISSVVIYCEKQNVEVVTLYDGFKWIMRGDTSHACSMSIEEANRIYYRGGSCIRIARDNPTKNPAHLNKTITTLKELSIDKLITIGGDDTAFTAKTLAEHAKGQIRVVHVPKTIDNDLDLPEGISTFGFQTARHYGSEIIKRLAEDALTTSRWYFTIAMGRKAGHLALGIGKAASATVTLIAEEFSGNNKLTINKLVDILAGSIIKQLSYGRKYGVAVIAEGLVEAMTDADIKELSDVERDEHGNIRIAEVDFGGILKKLVKSRLKQFNIKTTIVSKNIGYELRCVDPIAFDLEYTRELGYNAAKYIIEGGNQALISVQNGRFVPMHFEDITDPDTGRSRIRMVNVNSEGFKVAQHYMTRLTTDDFTVPKKLTELASVTGIESNEFRKEFEYVI
ncbi:MAG: diphosphate--fructose-6-phosphate 1-phosphotransferase [Candidatus Hatepunaea meridiana]|nr:diphosphate--fructose-6-phosphate 1-phosphotransferase [Candidatus Hatepunaea meridiana]